MIKSWFNTDRKKGSFCFIVGLLLIVIIYLLTGKTISALYLIPGLFGLLTYIFWFTKPSERKITYRR